VRKLKLRHPHVYGQTRVRGPADVLRNWDRIKRDEKAGSILGSIPKALPALQQAQLIQERCRRVGFDWDEPAQVLDKVAEETGELRRELARSGRNRPRVKEELGDLLFALVNLGRHLGFDVEATLKDANTKFTRRFARVERRFATQGRDLTTVPLAEVEEVWQQAKQARTKATRRRA
jgi:ATP diphosphatase